MKTKSCLSWFGSGSQRGEGIGQHLKHHGVKHTTISFCGGLSELPWIEGAIVANDLNHNAIHFYQVVSGLFGTAELDALTERCEATLSHPADMEEALRVLEHGDTRPHMRAWAYWAACWIGRKGKGGTKHVGGDPSVRRTAKGGNNASRLMAVCDDLREWRYHFRRCEFTCMKWGFTHAAIHGVKSNEVGLYDDPPWVGPGRNYEFSFTEEDHRELAQSHNILRTGTRATILIRYGNHPLIQELYPADDWHWRHLQTRTQAGSDTDEVWISNKPFKGEPND